MTPARALALTLASAALLGGCASEDATSPECSAYLAYNDLIGDAQTASQLRAATTKLHQAIARTDAPAETATALKAVLDKSDADAHDYLEAAGPLSRHCTFE